MQRDTPGIPINMIPFLAENEPPRVALQPTDVGALNEMSTSSQTPVRSSFVILSGSYIDIVLGPGPSSYTTRLTTGDRIRKAQGYVATLRPNPAIAVLVRRNSNLGCWYPPEDCGKLLGFDDKREISETGYIRIKPLWSRLVIKCIMNPSQRETLNSIAFQYLQTSHAPLHQPFLAEQHLPEPISSTQAASPTITHHSLLLPPDFYYPHFLP